MSGLSFDVPALLVLLVVPLGLVVAYALAQRRRARYALRLSTVPMLDQVAPDRPGWRRHLPAVVLVVGVAAMVLAVARPVQAREVSVPTSTVILALDVSLSMEATDVAPNRLEAAQEAARGFVELVPDGVSIGLVTFDQTAVLRVAPSEDRTAITRAIDRLTLGPGTAIGEAIFTSLDHIPDAAELLDGEQGPPGKIVLMSDGETNSGRSNEEAIAAARSAGVPVSTIAFGTPGGTVTVDGQRIPVPVDRDALRAIATRTGGTYAEATTADELEAVFDELGRTAAVTTTEEVELWTWFAGAALVLVVAAAAGSVVWFSRVP